MGGTGGGKLRKTVVEDGAVTLVKDYSSGYVYTNEVLDYFRSENGRIRKTASGYTPEYHLTDHLGNVRVAFEPNGSGGLTRTEEQHYYPFGMELPGLSYDGGVDNEYRYNGKEHDKEHELHWYHYGARFYDPQLGRWHAPDPADEYYSPYIFVGNMVVNAIDPNGKETIVIITIDEFMNTWPEYGSHAGLIIADNPDGVLFDPGGGYTGYSKEGSQVFPYKSLGYIYPEGDFDLPSYIEYHQNDGSRVIVMRFKTTPEQEQQIIDAVDSIDKIGPFNCASAVGQALNGSSFFSEDLDGFYFLPGDLHDDLMEVEPIIEIYEPNPENQNENENSD
jgi:RHS repeat-associated protein